ncbi:MAG: hypothetical protein KIT84_32980 [Labilithrix sp.]|nr:hypothetical protein [Labilithrix sp.]MCW5815890.1 hypothetical protein [Labilithrix sp.]
MGARSAVTILAAALLAAACKKPPPPPEVDAGKPKDHLREGEFPEGHENAFGLVLPRDSSIVYRITDMVEVRSRLLPEELSNYVRAHVQDAKIVAGAQKTTFEDAVPPKEPNRRLHIEVTVSYKDAARSSMRVRDVTPPPPAPSMTPDEAYRKAGRGPDGKPLDPKNMF